jgi:peptidyl-prolyl cis-trans isomerase SurA
MIFDVLKRCIPVIVLAFFSANPAFSANDRVQLVDRIVAVVNNDVITQFELDDRLKMAKIQLQHQGTPLPPDDALMKQLLDRMISDKVQLQLAQNTGIRVDDTQLDRALQRLAEQNHLSLADFRNVLEKDGVNFQKFREDIRNEIIISRLREREVDNRIFVSEPEIDNFLKSRQGQTGQETEYNLAYILVQVPEQATPEQIQESKAKAEKALGQLQNGADFGQVSAAFSDAPNALEGGALGWRSENKIPTLFLDTLKNMNPGELSPIIHTPNGFQIIKLIDKRGKDAKMIVEQTHARHILIKTSEVVSEDDAKRRLSDLRERILNGASFAELARLQSEDGSASKGGDLGWLSPGDTVPEFEKAMDALKPGEISQPVRSPFGWHLIQVLERRQKDVTAERERLQARQEIRDRKSDEAYQEWLRQLRDQAYIEYHLEDK